MQCGKILKFFTKAQKNTTFKDEKKKKNKKREIATPAASSDIMLGSVRRESGSLKVNQQT